MLLNKCFFSIFFILPIRKNDSGGLHGFIVIITKLLVGVAGLALPAVAG